MTHQELEYLRACTSSHKRDLTTASHLVTLNGGIADMATITGILDKIEHSITMMYITLEAEVTEVTDNETATSEVTPNVY